MSRKAEGIHGMKWNAIGNWGSQLIGFVMFTVLARLLEPEAFGLVALVSIYVAFMNLFVTQGFGMAIIQRKELEPGHLDTAFWISMGASVFFAAGTLLASAKIAVFLGDAKLRPYISVLSLDFIFMALVSVQTALLFREMRFFQLTIRQLVAQVCGGVTGILMALAGFGAWSLIGQTLVTSFVAFLTTWTVCNYRPSFNVSWKHLRQLWGYSWAVVASNFMSFFSSRVDQFFIGRAINSISLGFYSIGQKIITLLVGGLTGPVTSVAIPMLSKFQDDKNKVTDILYHGLEMASMICYPLFFGLVCLAPDVIILVFGGKWSSSGVLLRIFTISEIIGLLSMFNYAVFMSLGKPHLSIWILLIKAVGTAGAALIGIRWGMIGIAIGMVANNGINTVVSIMLVKRMIPVSLVKMVFSIRIPLLCATLMTLAISIVYRIVPLDISSWIRILICTLSGAAVYVSTLILISKRLFNEALEYLRLFLKGKRGE